MTAVRAAASSRLPLDRLGSVSRTAADLGTTPAKSTWVTAGPCAGAATVLADDPIFGRFCFGGDWQADDNGLQVVPKDGVRRRFHAMLKNGRVHLELEADRFAADAPIRLSEDLTQARFQLESDNAAFHTVPMSIAGLPTGEYNVVAGDEIITTFQATDGSSQTVDLPVSAGRRSAELRICAKSRVHHDADLRSPLDHSGAVHCTAQRARQSLSTIRNALPRQSIRSRSWHLIRRQAISELQSPVEYSASVRSCLGLKPTSER